MISLALTAWISFGAAYTNVAHPKLPVSIEGCPAANNSLARILPHNEMNFTTVSSYSKLADFVTEQTTVGQADEK